MSPLSLANFGLATDFVTRLPKNDLGDACLAYLRSFGVGTAKIIRGGNRIGIYFLENGRMQRGSKVVYDRAGSSLATIRPGMVAWGPMSAGRLLAPLDRHHPRGERVAPRRSSRGDRAGRADRPHGLLRSQLPRQTLEVGEDAGEVMPETGTALRHRHRQRGGRR